MWRISSCSRVCYKSIGDHRKSFVEPLQLDETCCGEDSE